MTPIQQVVFDAGLLGILILAGFFIRKKVKLLQDLYIPAAMVAGFLGLLLGPQVLGTFSPICFPLPASLNSWAATMSIVVFSVSFLGTTPKDFGEAAYSTAILAGIGHQLQVVVGLLCAFAFMGTYAFPLGFGLTPVFGFYGGHGVAMAAGTLMKDMGWAEAVDVANTMATAGLVGGIAFGIVMINIGARRGMIRYVREPSRIPAEIKIGYVEPSARKPIGRGVTYNDVVDPFGFMLCWGGGIAIAGYLLRQALLRIHPILGYVPWFACCLIMSMVAGTILRRSGLNRYIDRASMTRISGFAMDYLVCAAICTLNLKTVATYIIPLVVTIAAIFVANIIFYTYFAAKLFRHDGFERMVGSFGQGCGVLATGLMLIRIVDPNGESSAADAIAAASTIGYLWMIPYFTIGPIVSFTWGFPKLFLISVLLLAGFILLGRLTCWRKEPAWKTQPFHSSE